METGIERRRHLRAPIDLPVILTTSHGLIKGKTANISVSGVALLFFDAAPEIGDEFEFTIKMPDGYEMVVTCEKIWVGEMVVGKTVYKAIGVQFAKISPSDRKMIISMVTEYYL